MLNAVPVGYNYGMSYKYFNPNPVKATAGDCVVRMYCAITGKSWAVAYEKLADRGAEMGDMPNAKVVWVSLLRDLGFQKKTVPNYCPDCYTIKQFAKEHPYGLYAVCTGTHVVAVVDGDYMDSWDSGEEAIMFYLTVGG